MGRSWWRARFFESHTADSGAGGPADRCPDHHREYHHRQGAFGGFSRQSIAVEATGTFVVAGGSPAGVMRVDPGAQTIVSDATTGSGPSFASGMLTGIVVEPTGDLVVIDTAQDIVARVNPVTGNRTVISSNANAMIGSGLAVHPMSITASAMGPCLWRGVDTCSRWTPTLACAVWLLTCLACLTWLSKLPAQ